VAEVILDNFERCLELKYHTYYILKYLNNFRYLNNEGANENEELR
jgi:hypothetical protein